MLNVLKKIKVSSRSINDAVAVETPVQAQREKSDFTLTLTSSTLVRHAESTDRKLN